MKSTLTILIAALFGVSIYAQPDVNNPTFKVHDQIGNNVLPLAKEMINAANNAADGDVFNVIIDSPGGSIIAGREVLKAMQYGQARGITYKCYVDGMAISMAFVILAQCDERYAHEWSLFLFHPARVSVFMATFTSEKARKLARQLDEVERQLLLIEIRALKMPKRQFLYHYNNETLHTSRGLLKRSPKFMKIIPIWDNVRILTGGSSEKAEATLRGQDSSNHQNTNNETK